MKKQINDRLALGKEIKSISYAHGGGLVIVFKDDSFIVFEVEIGYDPGDECIACSDTIGMLNFDSSLLINLGIISQNELDNRRKQSAILYKLAHEKKEKEMYEKLKKKYEI